MLFRSDSAKVSGSALVTKCLFVQQLKHNITTTNTHVFIGCEGHTWEHWERNIAEIGERHEYSTKEIDQTKRLLELLKEQLDL